MTQRAADCIVIGSGPSGVACASALLDAGRSVLMLDVGLALEPERARTLADAPRPLSPSNAPWIERDPSGSEVPRKLSYGSDFPYREATERLRLDAHHVGAEPSFARGGLSNVWGAAALPFAATDIGDWPITATELAPHYAACTRMLGLAAEADDLAALLPLNEQTEPPLKLGRQGAFLHEKLSRHRAALAAEGLHFGRARHAVQSDKCVYCGLCLRGCPDQLIYSADRTRERLTANPRFSYRAEIIVRKVSETGDGARIDATTLHGDEPVHFAAERIFVAAGAIPTTELLLSSANMFDQPVRMKDSQYFLLPLLLFKGAGRAREEKLHTMAQLFLELRDPAISPYLTHMQVYTYNDVMAEAVRQRLGSLMEWPARFADAHLALIQGYLHSDHSGEIEFVLRRDKLEVRGISNPDAPRYVSAVVKKLMQLALKTGALPVPPLMQITEPGRGFHIGGSLPMQTNPTTLGTDTLGRPFEWRRIHAVDATVLPSIPATTITLPVMANAHRIATAAAKL